VCRQDAEATHGNEAEGIARTAETPSDDVEHAVTTVGTTVAACTSPEAAAPPDGDAVPASDKGAHATTSTEGPTGGDVEERVHAGKLEAVLLPARSPEREAPPPHPEPAGAGQTDPLAPTTEAEV
jgi:hypothetical protein